jgi:hypothetical protein
MYGGPWSSNYRHDRMIALLLVFMGVALAAIGTGWLLWTHHQSGPVLNLMRLPVEAVFWIGFALPVPSATGPGAPTSVTSTTSRRTPAILARRLPHAQGRGSNPHAQGRGPCLRTPDLQSDPRGPGQGPLLVTVQLWLGAGIDLGRLDQPRNVSRLMPNC